jgi:hypothetical protein
MPLQESEEAAMKRRLILLEKKGSGEEGYHKGTSERHNQHDRVTSRFGFDPYFGAHLEPR